MITISHKNIERKVVLQKEFPYFFIVVESPDFFYKLVSDFILSSDDEESDLMFFHNDEGFEFSRFGLLIDNIFSLNFNDKKNINSLHKSLSIELQNSEYIEKFAKINENISELLSLLSFNYPTPIQADELDIVSLFRAIELKYKDDERILVNRIIRYVQIFANIKELRFVVFVNLSTFLNEKDILILIDELSNNGIYCLFLEGRILNKIIEDRGIVITEDGSEL